MIRLTIFALLCIGPPAAAQTIDPAPWRQAFDDCVLSAGEPNALEACRSFIGERCMEETEGGWSNLGMTACVRMEGQLWDDLLNADWPGHKAWAQAADVADQDFFGDQYSARSEWLLKSQRAWIAFRDAQCALEYARWGSGSLRYPTSAACKTDMTANRVIELRNLTENF